VNEADMISPGIQIAERDLFSPIDSPTAPFVRGGQNLKQAFNVLQTQVADVPMLGALLGQDVPGAVQDIAEAERTKAYFPQDEATRRGLERLSEAGSFGEAARALATREGLQGAFVTGLESLVSSTPGLALAGLGAMSMKTPLAPLAPGLIGAGAGLGSAGVEFGTSFLEFAREFGVDPSNPSELEQFYSDADTVQQAQEFAKQRAAGVGIFDALSGATAGRILQPVRRIASGAGAGRRTALAAGGLAETAQQAILGAAGEATAQQFAGQETKPGEILLEGVAEIFPGLGEIALGQITGGPARGMSEIRKDIQRLRLRDLDLSEETKQMIKDGSTPDGQAMTVDSILDRVAAETDNANARALAQEIRRLSKNKEGALVAVVFDENLTDAPAEYRPSETLSTETAPATPTSGQTILDGESILNAESQLEASEAVVSLQDQVTEALERGAQVAYITPDGDTITLGLAQDGKVIDQNNNEFQAGILADGGAVAIQDETTAPTKQSNAVIAIGKDGFNVEAVMHESIHALTHQSLPESIRVTSALQGQDYIDELNRIKADQGTRSHVRDLIDTYLEARNALATDKDLVNTLDQDNNLISENNGLANIEEFLAEVFSNTEFQAKLAGIESRVGARNLLQKLAAAIKGLIGINVPNTLLEDALVSGAELIQSGKKAGKKKAKAKAPPPADRGPAGEIEGRPSPRLTGPQGPGTQVADPTFEIRQRQQIAQRESEINAVEEALARGGFSPEQERRARKGLQGLRAVLRRTKNARNRRELDQANVDLRAVFGDDVFESVDFVPVQPEGELPGPVQRQQLTLPEGEPTPARSRTIRPEADVQPTARRQPVAEDTRDPDLDRVQFERDTTFNGDFDDITIVNGVAKPRNDYTTANGGEAFNIIIDGKVVGGVVLKYISPNYPTGTDQDLPIVAGIEIFDKGKGMGFLAYKKLIDQFGGIQSDKSHNIQSAAVGAIYRKLARDPNYEVQDYTGFTPDQFSDVKLFPSQPNFIVKKAKRQDIPRLPEGPIGQPGPTQQALPAPTPAFPGPTLAEQEADRMAIRMEEQKQEADEAVAEAGASEVRKGKSVIKYRTVDPFRLDRNFIKGFIPRAGKEKILKELAKFLEDIRAAGGTIKLGQDGVEIRPVKGGVILKSKTSHIGFNTVEQLWRIWIDEASGKSGSASQIIVTVPSTPPAETTPAEVETKGDVVVSLNSLTDRQKEDLISLVEYGSPDDFSGSFTSSTEKHPISQDRRSAIASEAKRTGAITVTREESEAIRALIKNAIKAKIITKKEGGKTLTTIKRGNKLEAQAKEGFRALSPGGIFVAGDKAVIRMGNEIIRRKVEKQGSVLGVKVKGEFYPIEGLVAVTEGQLDAQQAADISKQEEKKKEREQGAPIPATPGKVNTGNVKKTMTNFIKQLEFVLDDLGGRSKVVESAIDGAMFLKDERGLLQKFMLTQFQNIMNDLRGVVVWRDGRLIAEKSEDRPRSRKDHVISFFGSPDDFSKLTGFIKETPMVPDARKEQIIEELNRKPKDPKEPRRVGLTYEEYQHLKDSGDYAIGLEINDEAPFLETELNILPEETVEEEATPAPEAPAEEAPAEVPNVDKTGIVPEDQVPDNLFYGSDNVIKGVLPGEMEAFKQKLGLSDDWKVDTVPGPQAGEVDMVLTRGDQKLKVESEKKPPETRSVTVRMPIRKEIKDIKDIGPAADRLYRDPTLRPHQPVPEEPVEMKDPEVRPIAQVPQDTRGPRNIGRDPRKVYVRMSKDDKIRVEKAKKDGENAYRESIKDIPFIAKDGVALIARGLGSMVLPVFAIMDMMRNKIIKENRNPEVVKILNRYKRILDPKGRAGLQKLVETQARQFTARIDRALENNKFVDKNGNVTMTEEEKDAVRKALQQNREIENREDLNNVVKEIRDLYSDMRDHMNAAKKQAYQKKIDDAIAALSRVAGSQIAVLVERINERRHEYGKMENKKTREGETLLLGIARDLQDLNMLLKGNTDRRTIESSIKDVEKLYDKAQPIGFVENYFPRRFRLTEIAKPENVQRFILQATNMFERIKEIEVAALQDELDTLEASGRYNDEGLKPYRDKLDEAKAADPVKKARELWTTLTTSETANFEDNTLALQFTKSRKLPADVVEEFLGQPEDGFMDTDPLAILNDYIATVSRSAELIKNFGERGDFMKEDANTMKLKGVKSEMVEEWFKHVQVATGVMRHQSNLPSALQSAMNWFNGVVIITLLTRAGFSALAEPLNVGISSGSAKAGAKALGNSVQALFGKGDTKEWASLFESLGIIASGFDQITFTNRFNDTFDSPRLQKLMQRAMKISGMHALDRASRIAAGQGGHAFLVASARAHIKAIESGQKDAMSKVDLTRFGVPKNKMTEFSRWLLEQETIPTSDAVEQSEYKDIYVEAMGQFIDTAIQNPKAVDKPYMASNPVGKIIFGLMSFSFAYQRNILGLVSKRVIAGMRGEIDGTKLNAQERMQMATLSILPLITLYAGVAIISAMREGLADDERLEELLDSDDPVNNFWGLAASRAGLFGSADTLVQAWTGLKYRRDLTNAVVGPSAGYTLQAMGDVMRGLQAHTRGESTQASNQKTLEGLYKLTVAPVVVTSTALLPQNRLLDPAFGWFNALVTTAPSVRKGLAGSLTPED
jgi:hypothetical protein